MVCYQTFCWNFHRSLQTVIPLHNPGCEAAASTRNELWERSGATCLPHATQEGCSRAGSRTQTFASPSVHYTCKCHLLVSSPHQYISLILLFLFSVNKVFKRAAEKQTASNAFRKGRREQWMQHEGSTVHGWDSHVFSWASAHHPVHCELWIKASEHFFPKTRNFSLQTMVLQHRTAHTVGTHINDV